MDLASEQMIAEIKKYIKQGITDEDILDYVDGSNTQLIHQIRIENKKTNDRPILADPQKKKLIQFMKDGKIFEKLEKFIIPLPNYLIDPLAYESQNLPELYNSLQYQIQADHLFSVHQLLTQKEFENNISKQETVKNMLQTYSLRQLDNYSQKRDLYLDQQQINKVLNQQEKVPVCKQIMLLVLLQAVPKQFQAKILKSACYVQPIPLILMDKNEQPIMPEGIHWVIQNSKLIINVAFGQACNFKIGKTRFINTIFSSRFEENDRVFYQYDRLTRSCINYYYNYSLKSQDPKALLSDMKDKSSWSFIDINGKVDEQIKKNYIQSLRANLVIVHLLPEDINDQHLLYCKEILNENQDQKLLLFIIHISNTDNALINQINDTFPESVCICVDTIDIKKLKQHQDNIWNAIKNKIGPATLIERKNFNEKIIKRYLPKHSEIITAYEKIVSELERELLQEQQTQKIFQFYNIMGQIHKLEFIFQNMLKENEAQRNKLSKIEIKINDLQEQIKAIKTNFELNKVMCLFFDTISLSQEQENDMFKLFAVQDLSEQITRIYNKLKSVYLKSDIDISKQTEEEKFQYYDLVEGNRLSITLFFREISQYREHDLLSKKYAKYESIYRDFLKLFIECGEPFEILDGEILKIMSFKDQELIYQDILKNEKLCTISIFGLQSSGKSTALNNLLRTKFLTSNGRCTQGCFASILRLDQKLQNGLIEESKAVNQDYIPEPTRLLVIDTEGFGSLERQTLMSREFLSFFLIKKMQIQISPLEAIEYPGGFAFDVFIASICLSVSNLSIINIKGDTIDDRVKDLLFVTLVTISSLTVKESKKTQLRLLLNQVADTTFENINNQIKLACSSMQGDQKFRDAITDLVGSDSFSTIEMKDILTINEEVIRVAPSAYSTLDEVLNKSIYQEHPCYEQTLNMEYLDKLAIMFNDSMKNIYGFSNDHFKSEDWFKHISHIFNTYYDKRHFFDFKNHHEIRAQVLLRKTYTEIQQRIDNWARDAEKIIQDWIEKLKSCQDKQLEKEKLRNKNYDKDELSEKFLLHIEQIRTGASKKWKKRIDNLHHEKKLLQTDDQTIDTYKWRIQNYINSKKLLIWDQAEQFLFDFKGKNDIQSMETQMKAMIREQYSKMISEAREKKQKTNFDDIEKQLKLKCNAELKHILTTRYKMYDLKECYDKLLISLNTKTQEYSMSKKYLPEQLLKLNLNKEEASEQEWTYELLKNPKLSQKMQQLNSESWSCITNAIDCQKYQYVIQAHTIEQKKRAEELMKVETANNKYPKIQQFLKPEKKFFIFTELSAANLQNKGNYLLQFILGQLDIKKQTPQHLKEGLNGLKIGNNIHEQLQKMIKNYKENLEQDSQAKSFQQLIEGSDLKGFMDTVQAELTEFNIAVKSFGVSLESNSLSEIYSSIIAYTAQFIMNHQITQLRNKLQKMSSSFETFEKKLLEEAKQFNDFLEQQKDPKVNIYKAKQVFEAIPTCIEQIDTITIDLSNQLNNAVKDDINAKIYADHLLAFVLKPQEEQKEKYYECFVNQKLYRQNWLGDKFEIYSKQLKQDKITQKKQRLQNVYSKLKSAIKAMNIQQKSNEELYTPLCFEGDPQKLATAGITYFKSFVIGKLDGASPHFELTKQGKRLLPIENKNTYIGETEFNYLIDIEGIFITNIGFFLTELLKFLEQDLAPIYKNIESEINKIYETSKKTFVNKQIQDMCPRQCFNCQKYCDQIKDHSIHKCQTGHLFNGFRGSHKANDGQVVLVTCEQFQQESSKNSETYSFKVNDSNVNWQDYVARNTSSDNQWDFSGQENKELQDSMEKIWKMIGRKVCEQHKIKYNENFHRVE